LNKSQKESTHRKIGECGKPSVPLRGHIPYHKKKTIVQQKETEGGGERGDLGIFEEGRWRRLTLKPRAERKEISGGGGFWGGLLGGFGGGGFGFGGGVGGCGGWFVGVSMASEKNRTATGDKCQGSGLRSATR